jgi:DNA excision repair protein ERCC-1
LSDATPKIAQPTPQARGAPGSSSLSSIVVSPRQRGNPVLSFLKTQPWEYGEIVADYVVGATTCVLFLSLKYHRLHPEYIYTRIRSLQGKYSLRIILTMVDIPNHEDALRELSRASIVHNVTVMLCWSAAEAARYLEFYKSYERSDFGAIKGHRNMSYAERLIEFVTVPRSVNKADAVALVSNFGSLRNAVNGDADEIGLIGGWGGVKVKRWCDAVQEPFRARNAATRRTDPVYAPPAAERQQQQQRQQRQQGGGTQCAAAGGDAGESSRQSGAGDVVKPDSSDMRAPQQAAFEGDEHQEAVAVMAVPQMTTDNGRHSGSDESTGRTGIFLAGLEREAAAPQGRPAAPSSNPALASGVAEALARLRQQ